MKLKNLIKLTMLSVIILLGNTYIYSNHAQADTKNEFPRIKQDEDLNGNNLKLNKINSSEARSKNYKLINRSKIKNKLFFQKSGYLYSKHLDNKYSIYTAYKENNETSGGFAFYADYKEKLYNKKTRQYNTYYHLSTLNGNKMGWTWDKNLVAYQSSNTKLNKTIRSIFPGAKINSDLQYLVNAGELDINKPASTYGDSRYLDIVYDITETNPYQTAKTGKHEPYILKTSPINKKYLSKLNTNQISYKNYVKIWIKNRWKHFNLNQKSYKNYQIGVLSYPKSNSKYGYFSLLIEKIN